MKLLWGVNSILKHLRDKWGWRICRQHLWRLHNRKKDPLPMTIRLRSLRAARVASPKALDAWMKRNYSAAVSPPPPPPVAKKPVPITGHVEVILFEET